MTFNFDEFPILHTKRLMLRAITLADSAAILRLRRDPEATRYSDGDPCDTLHDARLLINEIVHAYRDQRTIRWGVTLRDQPRLIGLCGYNYWVRPQQRASVGYELQRTYWGRGMMTEALRTVTEFGLNQMQLRRIEATTYTANHASIRVLEKVGFRCDSVGDNDENEEFMYFSLTNLTG
jgi:ribosomal-protein-alanine N-acetyltransferase